MKKRASSARADNEALWEWNLASDRIHFSPRWISLAGCEEHEVGNTPDEWLNRIHPEELPDVLRQTQAGARGAGRRQRAGRVDEQDPPRGTTRRVAPDRSGARGRGRRARIPAPPPTQ